MKNLNEVKQALSNGADLIFNLEAPIRVAQVHYEKSTDKLAMVRFEGQPNTQMVFIRDLFVK